ETLIRNDEVIKKKERGNSSKNDLITLINQITEGRTIIYFAQAYAWPGEPTPVVCERCDNCLRRFGDKPEQKDAFNEIKEMLDIVEIVCSNFTKEIRPTDVADVIRCNKNASVRREGFDELPFYTDPIKSAKPKGHTNCKLVITDLANNARTKGGS
ncbi:16094_t:CDS:2, partial [Gigaspora rosea]